MSGLNHEINKGLNADLSRLEKGSRGDGIPTGKDLPIARGEVTAIDGSGRLTIEKVGHGGTVVDTLANVRAWGNSTLTVGAKVLIISEGVRRVIYVVGVGGNDCATVPAHAHSSDSDGGFLANSVTS